MKRDHGDKLTSWDYKAIAFYIAGIASILSLAGLGVNAIYHKLFD